MAGHFFIEPSLIVADIRPHNRFMYAAYLSRYNAQLGILYRFGKPYGYVGHGAADNAHTPMVCNQIECGPVYPGKREPIDGATVTVVNAGALEEYEGLQFYRLDNDNETITWALGAGAIVGADKLMMRYLGVVGGGTMKIEVAFDGTNYVTQAAAFSTSNASTDPTLYQVVTLTSTILAGSKLRLTGITGQTARAQYPTFFKSTGVCTPTDERVFLPYDGFVAGGGYTATPNRLLGAGAGGISWEIAHNMRPTGIGAYKFIGGSQHNTIATEWVQWLNLPGDAGTDYQTWYRTGDVAWTPAVGYVKDMDRLERVCSLDFDGVGNQDVAALFEKYTFDDYGYRFDWSVTPKTGYSIDWNYGYHGMIQLNLAPSRYFVDNVSYNNDTSTVVTLPNVSQKYVSVEALAMVVRHLGIHMSNLGWSGFPTETNGIIWAGKCYPKFSSGTIDEGMDFGAAYERSFYDLLEYFRRLDPDSPALID